jgi:hypothetical protein
MQNTSAQAELRRAYVSDLVQAHSFEYRGWKVVGLLMPFRDRLTARVAIILTTDLVNYVTAGGPCNFWYHPAWGCCVKIKIGNKHHSLPLGRFTTKCDTNQRHQFKDISGRGQTGRKNVLDLTPDNVSAGSMSNYELKHPLELIALNNPVDRYRTPLEARLADPALINSLQPCRMDYPLK